MIKLHPYQQKAISFIKNKKKCALYLGMGLGKTVITLTSIADLLDEFIIAKVLIIAPKQVANNVWHTEIHKWNHLKHLTYSIVTGNERQKILALNIEANIYITNRENVVWLFNKKAIDWDMIVLDESSSFKSPTSKRFKYLKKFKYEYMVQLSGTPSPNGLLDLWSQIYLLDHGKRLGRAMYIYKQNHFNSDFMGYKYTPKNPNNIHNAIADITMSMKSEDYLELPPRINLITMLDNPALIQYKELEKEFITSIRDHEITTFNAATLTGKLLQLCNGAVYDSSSNTIHAHDAKLDALADLIEDNPTENILVAYNFKSDLKRLLERFKEAIALDGLQETINRWNNKEIKLLLAHPSSSGKGLNLQQGGNIIIWFGLTWNLEDYLQFNSRLHRQGQDKPTIINHIIIKDSIDEMILKKLDDKNNTQESLFKALKSHYNKYEV